MTDTDAGWGDLLDPDYVHDYVWEGEPEDREPRTFYSVHDIPERVVVETGSDQALPSYFEWVDGVRYMDLGRDDIGDIHWDDGEPGATNADNAWLQEYAPFIEVVGAK